MYKDGAIRPYFCNNTTSIQPRHATGCLKCFLLYDYRFRTGRPLRSNSLSPSVMMTPERSITLR